jgi:hypothetical protein
VTPKTFEEGIAVLSATHPSLEITGTTLMIWRRLLEDIEDGPFLSAVIRLCREEKQIYPGTNVVALIRERSLGGRSGIVALSVLEEAMRRYGAYKSIIFADPVIHLVVARMGGWPKLCTTEMGEWKFMRRDFERLYDAVVKEPIPENQIPESLPGLHEIGNAAGGHADHPIDLVDLRRGKALQAGGSLERIESSISRVLTGGQG